MQEQKMALIKLCLGIIAVYLQMGETSSSGTTTTLNRFVNLFNGYYSNVEDVRDRFAQDLINDTARPVLVPAFQQSAAIYFEQVTNNKLYRQHVLLMSVDEAGIITGIPYNFTDIGKNRPFTFHPTDLDDLTIDDFNKPPEDCNVIFRELDENVFLGSWPDCTTQFQNGERPVYAVGITSGTFSFVSWTTTSKEKATLVPYVNRKFARC